MTHIAFIHSYRGGTGKSNMAANLAATLADQGQRVGVIDTNLQAPSLHYLFDQTELTPTFAEEMLKHASKGIFVHRYPEHPITMEVKKVADALLAVA